jgi:hypothetical protein
MFDAPPNFHGHLRPMQERAEQAISSNSDQIQRNLRSNRVAGFGAPFNSAVNQGVLNE